MTKIMVVSNRAYPRSLLSEALTGEGHHVFCVDDISRVCRHFTRGRPEMVLLDLFMDGTDSWAIFHQVKCYAPEIPVMVYALKNAFGLERLKQSIHATLDSLYPAKSSTATV